MIWHIVLQYNPLVLPSDSTKWCTSRAEVDRPAPVSWQFNKNYIIQAGRKRDREMSWTVFIGSHGGWTNSTCQNRFFGLSDSKFPFWVEQRGKRARLKQFPAEFQRFFPCRIIPPTLEPCCCSRKTAGCLLLHQSWDRQSAKAQQGAFFFKFPL